MIEGTRECIGLEQSAKIVLIEKSIEKSGTYSKADKLKNVSIVSIMVLTNIFIGSVNAAIAPFYPKVALTKGAGATISSLVYASYTFATILMGPICAVLPYYVSLKFMLVAGVFLEGTTQILFGFLAEMPSGLWFILFSFLIRIIGGIGASPCLSAGVTICTSLFPMHVSLIMGILESSYGFGLMIGPPLGGFLYSAGGFRLPFFVIGLGTSIFSLIFLFVLPNSNDVPASRDPKDKEKVGTTGLLKVPGVLLAGFLLFAAVTLPTSLRPVLVFHLDQYSLTNAEVGLVFLIFPACYCLASPIYGCFVKNMHRLCISIGFVLTGVGFLLVGPSPLFNGIFPSKLGVDAFALVLIGLGYTPPIISSLPEMNKAARAAGFPDNDLTSNATSVIWLTLLSIGGTVGPALGGWLFDRLGFPILTTLIAFWSLLQIVILGSFVAVQKRKARKYVCDDENRALVTSQL